MGIEKGDGDVRDRRFGGGDVPQESFDLPTSMRDSARRQPAFVAQMSNEIVNLVRMDIQLPAGDTASNSRKRSQSVAI